jgi:hypothetical protein
MCEWLPAEVAQLPLDLWEQAFAGAWPVNKTWLVDWYGKLATRFGKNTI